MLRHRKDVTSDVEVGEVLLRRREEPDLRLPHGDRDAERADAFAAAGRALRNLAVHSPVALSQALGDAFPRLVFPPAADRRLSQTRFPEW